MTLSDNVIPLASHPRFAGEVSNRQRVLRHRKTLQQAADKSGKLVLHKHNTSRPQTAIQKGWSRMKKAGFAVGLCATTLAMGIGGYLGIQRYNAIKPTAETQLFHRELAADFNTW